MNFLRCVDVRDVDGVLDNLKLLMIMVTEL